MAGHSKSIRVSFWGTRGSYPISGKEHNIFGGNTSCVSIHTPNDLYIFDAGTGLIELGNSIDVSKYESCTLFLTHSHLDHIMGLPFFKPMWNPEFKLKIVAGATQRYGGIQHILTTAFSPPFFPVPWIEFPAEIEYIDALPHSTISVNDADISTYMLNHPGGCYGFRFDWEGRRISYITDTSHDPEGQDEELIEFVNRSNLLIYDAEFTEAEFKQKPCWGHSTWNQAVRVAKAAKIKRLALYHHDPDHDDKKIKSIETSAKKVFKESFAARQGQDVLIRSPMSGASK